MKATQQTIPILIEKREEFTNGSGTMRAVKNPSRQYIRRVLVNPNSQLSDAEAEILHRDSELDGITYLIMSYDTPIGWEVRGLRRRTHRVGQALTQTSGKHQTLLHRFHDTPVEN